MAPRPLLIIRGSLISTSHTLLAATAFSGAFVLACLFHFRAVCKNDVAGWPIEWFPSVSATIGDHMPSRPFFQIVIALCSGPRFLLILGQWLVTRREGDRSPNWVAILGVIRTFSCGGWVYITSTDGHDFHDFCMILYLLLTIPWIFGTILITQRAMSGLRNGRSADDEEKALRERALRRRRIVAGLFFGSLVPMIYFFVQHKVHRVPGSYTYYSILEWSLIAYDVTFDAISATECRRLQIEIIDVGERHFKDSDRKNGPGPRYTNIPSGECEGKDQVHSVSHTRFLRDLVQLHEPILSPFPSGLHDSLMEWPPYLSDWGATNVKLPAWRDGVAFLVDLFLAYCFWTIFTGLSLQLFYWSVWKLALSGSELTLFMILSPWLLSEPKISRFATSKRGQSVLRGIALGTGLTAYALPTPLLRLFAISIANVAAWLEVGGTLSHMKGGDGVQSYGLILGCGLVISLLLKLWNYSNNPLWCVVDAESGGWNRTGLVLAIVAWIEKHHRPGPQDPTTATKTKDYGRLVAISDRKKGHIPLIMGLGNLIFLLQTIITDAGTVIAWSWTGYPVKGPELLRQGFIPIGSACIGMLLSTTVEEWWLTSPGWSIFGCISCFVLVQYQDWTGFVGGCGLILFGTSLFPLFLRRLSAVNQTQIGTVFGQALLANAIWDVVSVLTVAYAFVPGGQLFRERMDIVMYFSVAMICWGLYDCNLEGYRPIGGNFKSSKQNLIQLVLIGSSIAGWMICLFVRNHLPEVVPYHSFDTKVWTGGIWAVHFGIDEEGHDSQRRMLELIKDMEVDVVGLLETDLHRFVYGNRDLTRMITEELGYYVDLGPGPNKHTWGAALLSKFPILESTHHLLPSPHGELAPAIHAKLLIHGQPINVIVSHNGQEEDPLDRELQSTALAKIMNEHYPEPFAFLGYLVTHVGASRPAPYEIIMADGKMWDVEIEDRSRWCQYIAFRYMWRVAYARVTSATISDTELQVARWVLPGPGETVSYQTNEELYRHWWEEDVDESWRFTRAFRGNGTRGHKYEIFDGPIYYLPPQHYQALLDKTVKSQTNDVDVQS